MHSWYTNLNSRKHCPPTVLTHIAPVLDDMNNAENYLQNVRENPEVQDIDYTVILPGGLTNTPATGMWRIIWDIKNKLVGWDEILR